MAVDRLLEQWQVLHNCFNELAADDSAQRKLAEKFRNSEVLLYMKFLSYVLNTVGKMNAEFQTERPAIHLLHARMTSLYEFLLLNYMSRSDEQQ